MSNKKPLFSERLKTLLVELGEKSQNKCLTLLYAIESAYEIDNITEEESSKSITMLDYRLEKDDILISYLAIGKTPEFTANEKWSRKNRQQGKVGKTILTFIKHYCEILGFNEPTTQELEQFVNLFKSSLSSGSYEFRLVKGEDILYYYDQDNYQDTSNGGYTLHSSCMRYKECQDYLTMYKYIENCELLIMFDKSLSSDKIVGRALVWTQNGNKYVDRRYYCVDLYEAAMVNYIKDQKWSYKSENTFDDGYNMSFYEFNSERNKYILNSSCEIIVKVQVSPSYYPYMDTLKYFDNHSNILTNNKYYLDDHLLLTSTDGSYEGGDEVECECCGYYVHSDHAIYVNDYGFCCESCASFDYFGNACLIEDLTTVYGKNDREYLIQDRELSSFAIHHEGTWYITPGTLLQSHHNLITYNRDEYTEDEFEDFKNSHDIINDKYALIK